MNKGSLVLMSLKLSSLLQRGMVHFEKSRKISSQPLNRVVPENIHTPPRRELEIPRRWRGGLRPRKFQRGGGLDDKNHFPRGLISNSVRKLLLTDLVDHF